MKRINTILIICLILLTSRYIYITNEKEYFDKIDDEYQEILRGMPSNEVVCVKPMWKYTDEKIFGESNYIDPPYNNEREIMSCTGEEIDGFDLSEIIKQSDDKFIEDEQRKENNYVRVKTYLELPGYRSYNIEDKINNHGAITRNYLINTTNDRPFEAYNTVD